MALTAAELEALARKKAAASGDAGSFTERSADDILKLLDRAAATGAAADANPNGGPKSALRMLRPARVQFPGANR